MSTDAEKAFHKIQHLFMIKKKKLIKVGREGTYLNIIKAIYDKPTANIIFNTIFKAENLPVTFKETRMSILPIPNQQSTEVLATAMRPKK